MQLTYQFAVVRDGDVQIVLPQLPDAIDSAAFHARGQHPHSVQRLPGGGVVTRPVTFRVERWAVVEPGVHRFEGVEREWSAGVEVVTDVHACCHCDDACDCGSTDGVCLMCRVCLGGTR